MLTKIILKREHFPESLDDKSIKAAYWAGPCIMEKAIMDAIPNFREEHFIGSFGMVVKKHKLGTLHLEGGSPAGRVKEWDSPIAYEIAEKMQKDPTYTQEFKLELD